jgi:hypothetical protein
LKLDPAIPQDGPGARVSGKPVPENPEPTDGRELYYVSPDGAMMAAAIKISGTTVEPARPVMLFPTRMVGGGADIQLGRQYDVTADGRFLVNTLLNEAPAPITLLQNWQPPPK